jgi:Zn-dependent protease
VTVDEERNIIILPGGQSVLGFDAEKYNSLYLRALYRPDIMNPKMQLMIVLGVITVILGVVTVITLNFVIGKKVSTMTQDLAVIKQHFLLLNTTII